MKGNNFPHQNTGTHDRIRVISYKAVESWNWKLRLWPCSRKYWDGYM